MSSITGVQGVHIFKVKMYQLWGKNYVLILGLLLVLWVFIVIQFTHPLSRWIRFSILDRNVMQIIIYYWCFGKTYFD